MPVPNSKWKSILSQSLNQVTFCTEVVWFRAKSVNHSELSSDSDEYIIISLNFVLIQRNSVITLQFDLKLPWFSTESWTTSEIVLNQYWLSLRFRHGCSFLYLFWGINSPPAVSGMFYWPYLFPWNLVFRVTAGYVLQSAVVSIFAFPSPVIFTEVLLRTLSSHSTASGWIVSSTNYPLCLFAFSRCHY